jgi:hypothetical protein
MLTLIRRYDMDNAPDVGNVQPPMGNALVAAMTVLVP